jgi:hypothetical protein
MNSKVLLGTAFTAVFVFAMMTNPVFAVSKAFTIDDASGFTISTVGNIGTATEGHAVVVYAAVTSNIGPQGGTIVDIAAVHPSFNDDPVEQAPGNKKIHAHEVELDANLCVIDINNGPSLDIAKKSVTITGSANSVNDIVAHAILGYDVTDNGLCPTEVYAFQPVA